MTFSYRAITALMVFSCLSAPLAAQGPPLFPPTPVNYGVGVLPHSVAIGDLNHDGNPDLVAANETSASISVLLGTGTGTFAGATSFAVGSKPYAVVIGEVNGDGALDVVVANYGWYSVGVLWGDGMGGFFAQTNYSLNQRPTSIAIGDLDTDGQPDIVTSSSEGSDVEVLLGAGGGYYAAGPVVSVIPPGWGVPSVAIADVNNDGRPDIAATGSKFGGFPIQPGFISVLLGTGTPGSFGVPITTFGLVGPRGLAMGDLNFDGRVDAVTANIQGTASVLFGNGTGSFGAPTDYPVGGGPASVAIGDLNGTGTLDIATANFGLFPNPNNTVSVLLGIGLGTFAAQTTYNVGSEPLTVALGDLNKDGRLDLVTANLTSNDVSVLLNVLPGIAGVASYGTGTSGCAGQLGMNTNTVPTVGNLSFALIGSNAPHSTLGFVLGSNVQDVAGFNIFGVLFHVGLVPNLISLNILSGPSGEQFAPAPLPNNPSLVGQSIYFQSFWVEPVAQLCTTGIVGFVSSRGLTVTFQP